MKKNGNRHLLKGQELAQRWQHATARLQSRIVDRVKSSRKELRAHAQANIRRLLAGLNIPDQHEVEQLAARLAQLEKKVHRFSRAGSNRKAA